MKQVKFDDVIPAALEVLRESFGDKTTEVTLVRDGLGSLSVVLPDVALGDSDAWNRVADQLHQCLGLYSPGGSQVLLRQSDLIDPRDVMNSPDRVVWPDAPLTYLVDRLQTNQDWLREALRSRPPLPTAVGFSIKGGVGRSTAFALWSWYLARLGKKVVLVDLDLEAPGVAGLLLNEEDQLPDYGLVDWFTEALAGQADVSLLQECLSECPLGSREPGQIQVLPAFGRKTREYVSKLGRIYMPTIVQNDQFVGFAERSLMLLDQIAGLPDPPDVVLLDTRAGLHDIGSAAVTRLGAEAFLFMRDDKQAISGYKQLLGHLRRSRSVEIGMGDDDLRWRLKMVGAQLEPTEASHRRLMQASYRLWEDLYDAESETQTGFHEPKVFQLEDVEAPHFPLGITFDPRIGSLDLINPDERPDWGIIETAFKNFFVPATERLFPKDDEI